MKLVAILACFVCGTLLIFNVSAAPKSEQHNAESYAIMITDFSDFMLVSDITMISQMELSVSIESSTYQELSYIPLDNIYTTNYTPITCAIAYL